MFDVDIRVLIPLFVALPLAVALLIQLVARERPALAGVLTNLAMLGLVLMSCLTIGGSGLYHLGGWPTPIGIDLRLDSLATLLLLAINIVGLAVGLYSVDYMRRYTASSHFYSLFLLMVTGMNGVVLAGDLFNLYVFLEVAAVASYSLVAFGCAHEELEASFKYIVLGSLSSALILIGVALVYGITGTLNMAQMSARIAETGMDAPLLLAFGLFICGFSFKAALVPFHAWLPDAHPSAPAPVSAMLSGVLIKAIGIYVLARLAFNVFGAGDSELSLLRWLGVLSMVVGGLLAAGQSDIKRLFAYSSISQVGFIILGLGLGTPLGLVGALYHLVNHAMFKSLLFLNAGRGGIRHRHAQPVPTGRAEPGAAGDRRHLAGRLDVDCRHAAVQRLLEQADHRAGLRRGRLLRLCRRGRGDQHRDPGLSAQGAATGVFCRPCRNHSRDLRREPRLMSLAMILLAAGCIALSFLVLSGLRDPWLIGAAQETLSAGPF